MVSMIAVGIEAYALSSAIWSGSSSSRVVVNDGAILASQGNISSAQSREGLYLNPSLLDIFTRATLVC